MQKEPRSTSFQTLSRWLSAILRPSASSQAVSDASRKIFIINLFCLVMVLFTASFAVYGLIQSKWEVIYDLLPFTALYVFIYFWLRRTQNHVLCGNLVLYPLYVVMLYLVYSGGVHGTGLVWIYCIPPMTLFLHGVKRGGIEVALFTIGLVVILFVMKTPFDELGYHPDLKSRIVYSFLLIACLSLIYEYVSSRFNHSLRHQLSVKLEEVAMTDHLTGLLSRHGLEQRLQAEEWWMPNVWLVNVDCLKGINEEFGHTLGDEYLKALVDSMHAFFEGRSVLISRWGGEEFLIVLNDTGDQSELANELREMMAKASVQVSSRQRRTISTSVSIGITIMRAGEPISTTLGRAYKALYQAKEAGRNRVDSL
ncbi:GGDEF domain-containing protein [Rhodanobacter aciditrophus]|uniref:diguanylate cyclase n=1 Tax=Rhodanobacter aciditrophus TaxID=1623218 RepID=A0ABW4AV38_9GAMM